MLWGEGRHFPLPHLCVFLIEDYFAAVAPGHDRPLSPPLLMITMQLIKHCLLLSAVGGSLFGKRVQDEE